MENKETSLSDCISEEPRLSYIPTFKVKEAVRKLKEECSTFVSAGAVCSVIDKIFGEKLI